MKWTAKRLIHCLMLRRDSTPTPSTLLVVMWEKKELLSLFPRVIFAQNFSINCEWFRQNLCFFLSRNSSTKKFQESFTWHRLLPTQHDSISMQFFTFQTFYRSLIFCNSVIVLYFLVSFQLIGFHIFFFFTVHYFLSKPPRPKNSIA